MASTNATQYFAGERTKVAKSLKANHIRVIGFLFNVC